MSPVPSFSIRASAPAVLQFSFLTATPRSRPAYGSAGVFGRIDIMLPKFNRPTFHNGCWAVPEAAAVCWDTKSVRRFHQGYLARSTLRSKQLGRGTRAGASRRKMKLSPLNVNWWGTRALEDESTFWPSSMWQIEAGTSAPAYPAAGTTGAALLPRKVGRPK